MYTIHISSNFTQKNLGTIGFVETLTTVFISLYNFEMNILYHIITNKLKRKVKTKKTDSQIEQQTSISLFPRKNLLSKPCVSEPFSSILELC